MHTRSRERRASSGRSQMTGEQIGPTWQRHSAGPTLRNIDRHCRSADVAWPSPNLPNRLAPRLVAPTLASFARNRSQSQAFADERSCHVRVEGWPVGAFVGAVRRSDGLSRLPSRSQSPSGAVRHGGCGPVLGPHFGGRPTARSRSDHHGPWASSVYMAINVANGHKLPCSRQDSRVAARARFRTFRTRSAATAARMRQ